MLESATIPAPARWSALPLPKLAISHRIALPDRCVSSCHDRSAAPSSSCAIGRFLQPRSPAYPLLVRDHAAQPADRVVEAQDRFISAWGQMGAAWGISRTMAEVFALLYITGQSLCTDDVIDRLQISRGNASMSLRALQDWGIIQRVHRRGDRKEYFESERDVWTIYATIARERKKRELDPVLASLYEIRDLTGTSAPTSSEPPPRSAAPNGAASTSAPAPGAHGALAATGAPPDDPVHRHNQRLDAMIQFMDTMDRLGRILLDPDGQGSALVTGLTSAVPDQG